MQSSLEYAVKQNGYAGDATGVSCDLDFAVTKNGYAGDAACASFDLEFAVEQSAYDEITKNIVLVIDPSEGDEPSVEEAIRFLSRVPRGDDDQNGLPDPTADCFQREHGKHLLLQAKSLMSQNRVDNGCVSTLDEIDVALTQAASENQFTDLSVQGRGGRGARTTLSLRSAS